MIKRLVTVVLVLAVFALAFVVLAIAGAESVLADELATLALFAVGLAGVASVLVVVMWVLTQRAKADISREVRQIRIGWAEHEQDAARERMARHDR